jgi:RNA polymerase sigma-70 factor (ECF subfamily)
MPPAEPGDAFVTSLVGNQRRIYAFIATLLPHPADVEDVYQQTCLALWKKRDLFDPDRDFYPWACGFAKLEVFKHLRHDRGRVPLSDSMLETLGREEVADPRSEALRAALDRCLEKLAAPQRDLLRQCYEGGRQIKEIAPEMAISAAALTMRLQRIRLAVVKCVDRALAGGAS